jgi:mono/diheme cytochrome c family protein
MSNDKKRQKFYNQNIFTPFHTIINSNKKMKKKNVFKSISIATLLILSNNITFAQSNSWPVPKAASELKNPIPANSNTLKSGEALYQAYCAPCHGKNGKGDGPAAASLHPKPADHTSAAVQGESDGTLFYKISEGHTNTAMPPFKAVLHPDQRWSIIDYIRTLAKK